jgi:hypothetical protein
MTLRNRRIGSAERKRAREFLFFHLSDRKVGRPFLFQTEETRGTSSHDNEVHGGSDSVFHSLVYAVQIEGLFLRASARTLLNFIEGSVCLPILVSRHQDVLLCVCVCVSVCVCVCVCVGVCLTS